MKNVPLKYMSVISLGKMLQSTPARADQEVFPYLKASNLTENGLDLSSLQQMPFSRREQEILQLQKDDVVVVEGGSIGRSAWISEDMAGIYFQNSINRVRPKIFADGRYLKYAIESRRASGFFEAITNQATIRHLTADKLANTPVPYLNQERQRKIADYLDHETAEIDAFIENLLELNELNNERLASVVDLETNQLATSRADANDPAVVPLTRALPCRVDYRGATPRKIDNGVQLVTARNVRMGWIDYESNQEYVDPDEYLLIMSRGIPEIHDLLFTMEAPLGNVALVDRPNIALAQRIIKFTVAPFVDPHFILYAIMSPSFQNQLNSLATGSTALGLKASKLHMLKFRLPKLAEQQAVADHLGRVFTQSQNLREETSTLIEIARERRAALITAAVTGQLDVAARNKPAAEQLEDDVAQGLHREYA